MENQLESDMRDGLTTGCIEGLQWGLSHPNINHCRTPICDRSADVPDVSCGMFIDGGLEHIAGRGLE